MDELEFHKRVLESPIVVDQELLDAASENPALQQILDEARAFESELQATIDDIEIPEGLSAQLLAIPSAEDYSSSDSNVLRIKAPRAKYFQYLALAAGLVLAVSISFNLGQNSAPSEDDISFGNSVLAHLYEDADEINAINSGVFGDIVAMPAVNETMANAGTLLASNELTQSLTVRSAKPCIIIPAFESAHLLIEGSQGAVSIFVINNSPVHAEYQIRDERFSGVVMPMGKGNMILVGEKDENLEQYKDLFSDSVEWVI